jgi:bifunctional non-homologous end joining protein LigD
MPRKRPPGRRDKLSTYRKKRDFQRTPEPAPEKPARAARSAPGALFVVHKHDATRLHYDLRLEMDGALASWAIPKGPSYNPSIKRLAVETEDHPLAYAEFEGRIPEGAYGAGDSLLWDKGRYQTVPPGQAEAMRKKGHLHVLLVGEKLQGGWHLVRTRPAGGKAQWLCIKAKDGTERPDYDVEAERPESVASGRKLTRGPERKAVLEKPHPPPEALLQRVWPPMLAVLSKDRPAPASSYLYEVKYDGYRAVTALSGGRVAVRSRNDLDFSARFPFVAEAVRTLTVGEAVLDGEIIALDGQGASRFQLLGDRGAEHRYLIFDLLWLDGEDVRPRPLEERRELLESLLANAALPLELATRVAGTEAEALAEAKRQGWEGLLAKRRGTPYRGTRSADWLKLKVHGSEELTIVGWTPQSRGAPEIGALLVAARKAGGFTYAGKVGTGFTDKVRTELLRLLRADEVPAPTVDNPPKLKGTHWVRPRHVAQVRFTEWTRDGRLRHPSFQGLREDKAPADTGRDTRTEKPAAGGAKRTGTLVRRRPAPSPARSRAPKASPVPGTAASVPTTHPEKVLFPKSGLTKADVRSYYDAVAPFLVPALDARPLSMQQWPRGIDAPGFFRQDAKGAPPWATKATVQHQERALEHLVVDRPETLSWLANQCALTLHMTSSRLPSLDSPDWAVFDFDPAGDSWEQLVPLAHALHALLEELKLLSVPKTSGKRGLHVFIPLAPGHSFEAVYAFTVAVGEVLTQRFPELGTRERALKNRHGRLYLDCEQNGKLKTMVAPYSLRAVEGAPASTPLHWDEVGTSLHPGDFNLRTLGARLARVGDLFAPALRTPQRLPRFQAR